MDNSAIRTFIVLYTKQKTQKSKKWQDGKMKFNPTNRKGTLYDDTGKTSIDSKFFGKEVQLSPDEVLEMDSFLITISEEVFPSNAVASSSLPQQNQKVVAPKKIIKPLYSVKKSGISSGTTDLNVKKRKSTDEQEIQQPVIHQKKTQVISKQIEDKNEIPSSTEGGRSSSQILARLKMRKQPNNNNTNNNESNVPFLLPNSEDSFPSSNKEEQEDKISNLPKISPVNKEMKKKPVNTSLSSSATPKRRRIGLSKSELVDKSAAITDLPQPGDLEDLSDEVPLTMHKKNNKQEESKELITKKPFVRTQISWNPTKSLCFPDTNSVEALTKELNGKQPKLSMTIPGSFKNTAEYQSLWSSTLYEELNLMLFKIASDLLNACHRMPGIDSVDVVKCPHGPAVLRTAGENTKNKGILRGYQSKKCNFFLWADEAAKKLKNKNFLKPQKVVLPSDLSDEQIQFIAREGVKLYYPCEIHKGKPKDLQPSIFGNSPAMSEGTYLCLPHKKSSKDYSKEDLWVISTSPYFNNLGGNHTVLARSLWHGPTRNGVLEIKPIEDLPKDIFQNKKLFAIHCFNASSEFSMLDNLKNISDSKLPVLPYLLDRRNQMKRLPIISPVEQNFKISLSHDEIKQIYEDVSIQYKMNEDQRAVLEKALYWFETTDRRAQDSIVLVHGVFGSGKSFLLVVLIIMLCKILDAAQNSTRILIASNTNVAVDRILLGLLEEKFTNFLRVGSLKKIAKPILQFTLQSNEGFIFHTCNLVDKETLKELRGMMKDPALSMTELKDVENTIKAVEKGDMKKRVQKLRELRVLGVTCAASIFPILDGQSYPIVLLDECSQMLEPLSLLPLNRFNCTRLMAVGDPLQLPPTISNFSEKETEGGLGKTMFIRLNEIGYEPILLRTQYRCHPSISKLANSLFYGNRLADGISASERPSVIENWPTLVFFNDDQGREVQDYSGSYYNEFEARSVANIVETLLENGVKGWQIGIITLYKAQAFKLKDVLSSMNVTVSVAVDEAEVDDVDDDFEMEAFKEPKTTKVSILQDIQVSTVDAFQGGEKDVIILACSRSTKLGFGDSPKRLNVAITRAKRNLFIVGQAQVLVQDNIWREIITSVKSVSGGFQRCSQFIRNKRLSLEQVSVALEDMVYLKSSLGENNFSSNDVPEEGEEVPQFSLEEKDMLADEELLEMIEFN